MVVSYLSNLLVGSARTELDVTLSVTVLFVSRLFVV